MRKMAENTPHFAPPSCVDLDPLTLYRPPHRAVVPITHTHPTQALPISLPPTDPNGLSNNCLNPQKKLSACYQGFYEKDDVIP
jgi:hypothetical protein